MSSFELIKQAIAAKGKANFCFSGKSMFPTLKESMMLTIANIPPSAIKISDIIAYQQDNIIAAHRVISIMPTNGEISFITKGDNQPFGGISQVKQKDLIGRIESAFYRNSPQENILNKNILYRLLYVLLGRTYLFYRKFIKKNIPEFLRLFLKQIVSFFYFIFRRFTYLTENLW